MEFNKMAHGRSDKTLPSGNPHLFHMNNCNKCTSGQENTEKTMIFFPWNSNALKEWI
jgi:hypothetical protein